MIKKIMLFLMVLFLGISLVPTSSLAQIPCTVNPIPGNCPVGEEWAFIYSDSCGAPYPQPVGGYCCLPDSCTAQNPNPYQCGNYGVDNCGYPCDTAASAGTCPPQATGGNVSNSTLTTCEDGFCVCIPDGSCRTEHECGSSAGVDNCGNQCFTAPVAICPSGQWCGGVFLSCIACPLNNPYCGTTTPANLTPPLQTTTPDPVNIFTGEAYFSSTDFSLGARGPKLALFRKYRSLSTFIGMFGYGWRTDFDLNLTQDSTGDVTIFDGDGTEYYFIYNSTSYVATPGNYSTLVRNADNTLMLTDKNGNVSHYDITGRLMSRTDRNGNTLTFVYNPAQVGGTYIQDASGRKIVLNFDSNGHIISEVDPAGKIYQYGYDTNGNLVSVTDPTRAVTNYVYNSNHQVIQFINANGHNTYYQYDSQGRCVMNYRDNNVNKTTLNYEANNTTVVTDSLGNNNSYEFNNSGLLIFHTDPLGAATQQTWDNNMNRLSITDARNNVTNFTYDSEGNLIQITDPLNNQTKMTYTPNFNLISTKTDALGNVTNFVYDNDGNLMAITDVLGNKHSFVYDQFGNVITATDTHGNTTNFTYDAFGHLLQKTDALRNSTNFTYR